MKRNNAEPIGKLIQQFLRQESLATDIGAGNRFLYKRVIHS